MGAVFGKRASSDGSILAIWFASVLTLGGAIGLTLPYLYEASLEVYAILLVAVILGGLLLMPRALIFRDDAVWKLFVVLISLFCIYPPYISLQISGLPWISPMRLVLAVLLFAWIYALKASSEMQQRIAGFVRANRLFFILLAVFIACQVLSIPTSRNPGQALQKFLLFQLYWTFPLFATLALAHTPSRLRRLALLFVVFAAIQCLVGFLEARQERLLWLDYLPPGFGADSEALSRILQGTFRAEGYRVQGSFTVSLVYAEFLAAMLPFALFAFIDGKSLPLRLFGLFTAVAILPAQYVSGSRLGMVGSIMVFLAIMTLYVIRIWRSDKRSMVGPLLLIMLPFGLAAFAAAFASSERLQALTLGGGAQQASTDSRFEMWVMGIPRILERPLFGHGSGLGAETLGFANLAGVLTIDSYWLNALLEFGIIGFVALFGMIGFAIYISAKAYTERKGPLSVIGGPVAVALLVFVIIKLVLSQTDNHLLFFAMMAMALIVRADAHSARATVSAASQAVPARGGAALKTAPKTAGPRPALQNTPVRKLKSPEAARSTLTAGTKARPPYRR